MFFLKFFIEHDSELLEIEGTSVADFFAENQPDTAAETSLQELDIGRNSAPYTERILRRSN